eukprot:3197234-Rhodomonas_salina.1
MILALQTSLGSAMLPQLAQHSWAILPSALGCVTTTTTSATRCGTSTVHTRPFTYFSLLT